MRRSPRQKTNEQKIVPYSLFFILTLVLTVLIQKSSDDVCTISTEIKKVNEENEKYKNQYEDMKKQKEKAEKDYICLVEQLKHTNGKTDEMNKRIQELEAVLTNFEQRNKNNGYDDVGFRVIQVKDGKEPEETVELTTLPSTKVTAQSKSNSEINL